jgi:DNA gyrase subunit A
MNIAAVSEQGRATQGVKLIRIDEGDEIAALTKMDVEDEAGVLAAIEGENGEGIGETDTTIEIDPAETTNLPENTSEGE